MRSSCDASLPASFLGDFILAHLRDKVENGELELQDLTLHDVLVIAELQEWDVSKSKLPKTVRQQVEKAQSQHKKDLGGGDQEVETLLRQLLTVFVGVSSEGEAGHRAEGVGRTLHFGAAEAAFVVRLNGVPHVPADRVSGPTIGARKGRGYGTIVDRPFSEMEGRSYRHVIA